MKVKSALWALLALGLALRLWGIGFGLPDLYHADEPIVVNHALAYGTGDLNPHFFKIPPLVSYLHFIVSGFYFLIGRGLGWFSSVQDFEHLFLTDPISFYLLGRVVFGALAGTLSIFLFYRLIRKNFSERHALLSAFFLSVSFLHVRDSHYIYVDIPLVLLLIASFFYIFRILERGNTSDYFRFGILFGMSVATKYNGVFLIIPFLLAHWMGREKGKSPLLLFDKKLILSALVSVGTYFVLNPFSLLDWDFFIKELLLQGQSESHIPFFHPLNYSLLGSVGLLLWAVALLGLVWAIFIHREKKRLVFASFLLFYYFPVLVLFSQPCDRYVLPLIPFFVFFAADFVVALSKERKGLLFVLAFVMVLPSLAKVVLSNSLFSKKDVRTVARDWVESSLPSGAKIALDIPFFAPRLQPTLTQLEEKLQVLSGRGAGAKKRRVEAMIRDAQVKPEQKRYELYFLKDEGVSDSFIFSTPSAPFDIHQLKQKGIEYVIVPSIHEPVSGSFYESLRKEAKLASRFSPYKEPYLSRSLDSQPLTGGPFLWKELIARERNGQIIEITN